MAQVLAARCAWPWRADLGVLRSAGPGAAAALWSAGAPPSPPARLAV